MRLIRVIVIALAPFAAPGLAEEGGAVAERVVADIEHGMGSGWTVRARWNDGTLTAFVTPPVEIGWEITSDRARQRQVTEELCAMISAESRAAMREGQRLAVVPVILGKALTHLRRSCLEASEN